LVKARYAIEESEEKIANDLRMPVKKISKGIKSALSFVSGKWPKRYEDGKEKSYKQFKWYN